MQQIPAPPVVAVVFVATLAGLVLTLRRRSALTVPRVLVAVAVAVLCAGVIANSFFPFNLDGRDSDIPWRVYLNLTPLADTEVLDMAQNVLIFVPIGFLLPLVTRVASAKGALLLGFVLSLVIESLQLLNALTGHGGHIADVNDLLANTLGTPIGYAVYRLAGRWPPARRLAEAASWPRRGPGTA